MKYIEWNIDPVALRVGGFPIMYYSLLLIAGTVLSVWILKRVYKENGMPWEHLQVLVMLSITGLFLGARLGHCLLYEYEYYFAHPLEILLPIRVKTDGTVVFSGTKDGEPRGACRVDDCHGRLFPAHGRESVTDA